ncbi:hypothetical protein ACROYT_G003373, partial [Oculina patagonica]
MKFCSLDQSVLSFVTEINFPKATRWNLCQVGELLWFSLGILMSAFSLATLTGISVDRLLALLLGISAEMMLLWLITSIYCYVRIYLVLRNHIQVQVTPQGQQNGISPLNLLRYKKTVSTALWVFAALIICYAPLGLVFIVNATQSEQNSSLKIIT